MTADELKTLVGQAALAYVPQGEIIGVGTGSTVNKFIAALPQIKDRFKGAVSSSQASTTLLKAHGITVFEMAHISSLGVYIDGADEINPKGYMIKGGGGALTQEKIVAAQAKRFVCIADESKYVQTLGKFPLPVEIIPMAQQSIEKRFEALGGACALRMQPSGSPFITDNGQYVLDVTGLKIEDPLVFENRVSQWAGVVTVGVFAHQKADIVLLATQQGVKTIKF